MVAMGQDDLVPLKQIVGALGVSRATLWRASKVVLGFPPPRVIAGRVFWLASELAELDAAMARFGGRLVFEKARRLSALRVERDKLNRLRRPRRPQLADGEVDLFEWASDQSGSADREQLVGARHERSASD